MGTKYCAGIPELGVDDRLRPHTWLQSYHSMPTKMEPCRLASSVILRVVVRKLCILLLRTQYWPWRKVASELADKLHESHRLGIGKALTAFNMMTRSREPEGIWAGYMCSEVASCFVQEENPCFFDHG